MAIVSTPINIEMRLTTLTELEDALKQIETLKKNNPNQDMKFEIRVNFLMFQSTLFKEFKRAERTSSV